MRTSPYGIDLREKVISFIESGNSRSVASRVFSLNYSTVSRWHKRYKEEGHYLARIRPGAISKIDKEALLRYVGDHPDAKLKEISYHFKVSLWGILLLV